MPTRAQLVAAINTLQGRTPLNPIQDEELSSMILSWLDYYDADGTIDPATFQDQLSGITNTYHEHTSTFIQSIEAAQTAANKAVDAQKAAEAAAATGRNFQEAVNIATNSPNLSALVLNNTTDKNKFWKVSVAGTTTITGTSINAVVGDEFTWNGTKWVHSPTSDAAYQRVISLENKAITSSGLAPRPMNFNDVGGWATYAVLPDGRSFPPLPKRKLSHLSNEVRDRMIMDIPHSKAIFSQQDNAGWQVAGVLPSGAPYPPKAYKAIHFAPVSTKKSVVNKYPNVSERLGLFASKLLSPATGDNSTKIVLWGDSVLARETHTSVLNVIPSTSPPGLTTKNFAAYLWESLGFVKPDYIRYDVDNFFTETGVFANIVNKAAWDDATYRPTETRLSVTASAAISWVIPADVMVCNFIDRTATDGAAAVTISATAGQLEVMLPGTNVWVEANTTTFSQQQTANAGQRIGNTTYQRRIPMRRKAGYVGTVSVSFTKDATATSLMYWGLETLKTNKRYVQLINVARGSHTIEQLVPFMQNDVIDRKPDLVIFELPLINMVAKNSTLEYSLNWVQDVVWGDRVGFENNWSLKAKSNNFADFQVLIIIPHVSRNNMNADKSFTTLASGYTVPEIHNAVKAMIYQKGNVPFVDMFAAVNSFAKDNYDTYYDAISGSSASGSSLTTDNTHMNDRGTSVWADHLTAIFQLNSL